MHEWEAVSRLLNLDELVGDLRTYYFTRYATKTTGSVPPQLGDLSALLALNLGGNELKGEFPAGIVEGFYDILVRGRDSC